MASHPTTRIRSGDYLLVPGDAKTIWRISRYREDGSLVYDDGSTVHGHFWSAAYFDGPSERAERMIETDPDEFLSWEHWALWENLLPTKTEAVQVAVKAADADARRFEEAAAMRER